MHGRLCSLLWPVLWTLYWGCGHGLSHSTALTYSVCSLWILMTCTHLWWWTLYWAYWGSAMHTPHSGLEICRLVRFVHTHQHMVMGHIWQFFWTWLFWAIGEPHFHFQFSGKLFFLLTNKLALGIVLLVEICPVKKIQLYLIVIPSSTSWKKRYVQVFLVGPVLCTLNSFVGISLVDRWNTVLLSCECTQNIVSQVSHWEFNEWNSEVMWAAILMTLENCRIGLALKL